MAVRYLFAGASDGVRYACVRGSSQGGEFDPSLARFYARAENNLHNGRCARHAGTIADEFTHFLTIRASAGINGAKCFRTGSHVRTSIKDLERTASRTAARGIYFGVNKHAPFRAIKTWCALFSADILSAII